MFKSLLKYISNPIDPDNNIDLAFHYDTLNQTSAAVSFYLRTAERTVDDFLKYKCLLYISICFNKQKDRELTIENILLKAISILPERQEAYLLLCESYERSKKWTECYTMANIGLSYPENKEKIDKIYFERQTLTFMKAVSAYWIGKFEESKRIFFELSLSNNLNEIFNNAIATNIDNIGYPRFFNYTSDLIDIFKYQFDGLENIKTNNSETFQDMFVLSVLNGKRNGSYLEFGCSHFLKNNNTFLLENTFNWTGLSIDIDCELVDLFNKNRKNPAICIDATSMNYIDLFDKYFYKKEIDYLQIDCDPANVSFEILTKIPFDDYKFSIITFEHDNYYDKEVKNNSRKFLKEKGYVLLVSDVLCFKTNLSYEDWWVHSDLIYDDHFLSIDKHNEVSEYFFNAI
jgi:hypothetical protein